jgi:5-formyltetrahydrofolate cyclo-ligase
MTPLRERKQDLRDEIEPRLRALDDAWIDEQSMRIAALVCSHEAFLHAASIGAYLPIGPEVRTFPVMRRAEAEGKTVWVPRFDPARSAYHFARWHRGCVIRRGRGGVPEPEQTDAWPAGAPDLILVPGVAFDRAGRRLGRGGGWYDRLLAAPEGIRAGIAWFAQVVDRVPTEDHDRSMDLLFTERGELPCNASALWTTDQTMEADT